MEITVRFPGARGAMIIGEEKAVRDAQEQTKEALPVELPEAPKEVYIDHGEEMEV